MSDTSFELKIEGDREGLIAFEVYEEENLMFDIKHYLLSLVGAAIAFYIINPLGPGCVMNAIIGVIVGFPLGTFCGVLIIDLVKGGFKRYHIVGFIVSFIPNFGVAFLGAMLMDARVPWQGTITIVMILSVTVCLACYSASKKILTKKSVNK